MSLVYCERCHLIPATIFSMTDDDTKEELWKGQLCGSCWSKIIMTPMLRKAWFKGKLAGRNVTCETRYKILEDEEEKNAIRTDHSDTNGN